MKKYYDNKINKNTDWGGDVSTQGLPVTGRRVQEFIKESLDSKAGAFHYDAVNRQYLVFADNNTKQQYLNDPTQTQLIISTFDTPFDYYAELNLSTPTENAILFGDTGNYIDFTFVIKSNTGQVINENVYVVYTITVSGNKKVITEKYKYGSNVHFFLDKYLAVGKNTIKIELTGEKTAASITQEITYQVIELTLTDTYDISILYDLKANPDARAAIPYSVSGYGTKVMEWYLDGELLPFNKVEDEIVDIQSTRTKFISLAGLSHGKHSLQFRVYLYVNGQKFYSDILYRDLLVTTKANLDPIIGLSLNLPYTHSIITNEIILPNLTQYIPYVLNFAVHSPKYAQVETTISLNDTQIGSVLASNNIVNKYTIRTTDYGNKALKLTAGDTVYSLQLNISKSDVEIQETVDGLKLHLSAIGRNNNDAEKDKWVYGDIHTTFNNFLWNEQSGWVNDRLLIQQGTNIDVDYKPLSGKPTDTGRTIEFEFSTRNVYDENAVILDLTSSNGAGILITASEAKLTSANGSSVSTKYKSEENIRITFVINRKEGSTNKGLIFIYIDGILSGAKDFIRTDNFTVDKKLKIGAQKNADIYLKDIKIYELALDSEQILNNYILSRDTVTEMFTIYDRNNIYEEGSYRFSPDKLVSQLPVMIVTGDIPALENTTDKKKTIYVDIEYINIQDPSLSFTTKGTRMRPQGTSSMGYPKKNFRIYTKYGTMYNSRGEVIPDGKYSFKRGAQPVDCWCFKADYAESSSTHNTGVARLWNDVLYNAQIDNQYIFRTEAQKKALENNYPYDVRTTVDGFPMLMFYRLNEDSELIFIGKYNFNNDKSTESVYGFRDIPGFDNSKMQCWEVLNNGNHLALFQDTNNFDNEWDDAFEARYPDGSTEVADLKAFAEWVVSTKNNPEKFKTEKWEHLDVYKVAAYYIYLLRFGAVDQPVKNAMLTSEDGVKWFYINYDNDTIAGVRNDGLLIYDYKIDRQSIDTSFSALVYAYAGHESTLWNNLEADEEFMNIVSQVDNALYIAGLSYEKTIEMFNDKQSDKWCERIYNQDAQYKYIGPYTDKGINNLFMLQGSRSAHRKWWFSNRFDYIDSQFVSGEYKSKSIEFKSANAPIGLKFSITAGNDLYYGYGLNNIPIEKGIKLNTGDIHTFTTKQVINVGDPLRVYTAVNIEGLDIHEFMPYISTLNISEVYNDVTGTKFKKLILGEVSPSLRNTSLRIISGLQRAEKLEYLDISGYEGITSLNLLNNWYIRVVKAKNSGLTSILIPQGSPLEILELPSTMTTISLQNLSKLNLSLNDIQSNGINLNNITIKNCNNTDTKQLLFDWYDTKVTNNSNCSVVLEGINWYDVDPNKLIEVGNIKTDGGELTLKGKIMLTECDQEQLAQLKQIYGEYVFVENSELYIQAPPGVFIIGPGEVLSGESAQYEIVVFSQKEYRLSYNLLNNNNNARFDLETRTLYTNIDQHNNYVILAIILISDGIPTEVQKKINLKRRIPVSIANISGPVLLNQKKEYEYNLIVNSDANLDYSTEWDVYDPTLLAIQIEFVKIEKNYLKLRILDLTACDFTLKCKIKYYFFGNKTVDANLEIQINDGETIATYASNKELIEYCRNNNLIQDQNKLTKTEAAAVTGTLPKSSLNGIKHFHEFQYFTNAFLTENHFQSNNLIEITLPPQITYIPRKCFYVCFGLRYINLQNANRVLQSAFEYTALEKIDVNDKLIEINYFAFKDTKLSQLPDLTGCSIIESRSFENNPLVGNISIPSNIEKCNLTAFNSNDLIPTYSSFTIDSSNTKFVDDYPKMLNVLNAELIFNVHNPTFYKDNDYIILNQKKVKYIGNSPNVELDAVHEHTFSHNLFLNNKNIQKIVLRNVKYIGDYALSGCSNLKEIYIHSAGNSIEMSNRSFGLQKNDTISGYTGFNTAASGQNIIYVKSDIDSYTEDRLFDCGLTDPNKCNFTLSKTL